MGDLDSILPETAEALRRAGVAIESDRDPDRCDLHKCLDYAVAHADQLVAQSRPGQSLPPTVVLGGLSGRMDHTWQVLSVAHAAAAAGAPVIVADTCNIVYGLPPGRNLIHPAPAVETGYVGIAPFGGPATGVSSKVSRCVHCWQTVQEGVLIET